MEHSKAAKPHITLPGVIRCVALRKGLPTAREDLTGAETSGAVGGGLVSPHSGSVWGSKLLQERCTQQGQCDAHVKENSQVLAGR